MQFCRVSEHALTSVVATVMLYDIGTKKWNDMGQSSVQIYQNSLDNTFRVVGSSRQTGQVSQSVFGQIRSDQIK